MAMDPEVLLSQVETAISGLLTTNNTITEYTVNGRTVRRSNLPELQQMRQQLLREVQNKRAQARTGGARNIGIPGRRR